MNLEPDLERRFGGIARLYGGAALEKLAHAHVGVIGIGGGGQSGSTSTNSPACSSGRAS